MNEKVVRKKRPPEIEAHCPRCDGERTCEVHGHLDAPWSWDDGIHSQYGGNEHHLLRCCGCKTAFYRLASWNSENWDGRFDPATGEQEIYHPLSYSTFPTPDKALDKPDWIWHLNKVDQRLSAIVDELYDAQEAGRLVLATIGLRTAFDRATEILEIEVGSTFSEKIKALLESGHIGRQEAESLSVLVEAGNASAHRAWHPDASQFKYLLVALEHFLSRNFSSVRTSAVSDVIPKKEKRANK